MGLANIAKTKGAADNAASRLANKRGAVAVRVAEKPGYGILVSPLGAAPAGTELKLHQPDVQGLPLVTALTGARSPEGRVTHRTAPGDLIVLEAAFIEGDALVCGRVAGRIHDGMSGPVQVMKALARISAANVHKGGFSQWVSIPDPLAARVMRNAGDVEALVMSQIGREFPGGEVSFYMRSRAGRQEFKMDPGEKAAAYVTRLVEANRLLAGGPVELMPIFSVHVGRDQSLREGINTRVETVGKVLGSVSKLYGEGYVPSLLILCDEDKWAFGGKTEKTHRVAACVEPLDVVAPIDRKMIGTANMKDASGKPMKPFETRELWSAEQMAVDAKRRAPEKATSAPGYDDDGDDQPTAPLPFRSAQARRPLPGGMR
ncbi:conserved hypothetical protein [Hyphomicrobiales bacterium]|nr:conserved hypothetical protein [Hyphomicrobiales bacterium]CAH1702434.1 conserved hypothetical protein [Hyphomicrobiales bacterium]CAI0346634.1 conserved hypothetical protein [Hyphomicrobiales bacterium]